MIQITIADGNTKYLNAELIERIEGVPDTRIVLVNGHSILVREPSGEVVRRIIAYKQACLANLAAAPQITLVERSAGKTDTPVPADESILACPSRLTS